MKTGENNYESFLSAAADLVKCTNTHEYNYMWHQRKPQTKRKKERDLVIMQWWILRPKYLTTEEHSVLFSSSHSSSAVRQLINIFECFAFASEETEEEKRWIASNLFRKKRVLMNVFWWIYQHDGLMNTIRLFFYSIRIDRHVQNVS